MKIIKIDKIVSDYQSGNEWFLQDYPSSYRSTNFADLDEWDVNEVNLQQAKVLANELTDYEYEIEIEEAKDFFELQDALEESPEYKRDNSYNQSWWGGVIDFGVLAEGDFDRALCLVRFHIGGDVRGNYTDIKAFEMDSYLEDFPMYRDRLTYIIKTDKGTIILDSDDWEGYSFNVAEDETGTFEDGDFIKLDELEDYFDTDDVDLYNVGGAIAMEQAMKKQKKDFPKTQRAMDDLGQWFLTGRRYAMGGGIKNDNGDIIVPEHKIKYLKFYPNFDAEIIEVGLGDKQEPASIYFDESGRDYIIINNKRNYVDDLDLEEYFAKGGMADGRKLLARDKGMGGNRDKTYKFFGQDARIDGVGIRKSYYEVREYPSNSIVAKGNQFSDVNEMYKLFTGNDDVSPYISLFTKGGEISKREKIKEQIARRIPTQKRMFEKELADLKAGKRKTINQYFVQGNYGYGDGFEDLTAHDTRGEAVLEKMVYQENESVPFRVVTKRIKKSDYESGNYARGGNLEKSEKFYDEVQPQLDDYRRSREISDSIKNYYEILIEAGYTEKEAQKEVLKELGIVKTNYFAKGGDIKMLKDTSDALEKGSKLHLKQSQQLANASKLHEKQSQDLDKIAENLSKKMMEKGGEISYDVDDLTMG